MKKKSNNRPVDFNLFLSSDTVLGTLESIAELTTEVPSDAERRMLWINAVTGLAEAGRKAARLNVFLCKASDRHNFPTNYRNLEKDDEQVGWVREEPGIYLASSR